MSPPRALNRSETKDPKFEVFSQLEFFGPQLSRFLSHVESLDYVVHHVQFHSCTTEELATPSSESSRRALYLVSHNVERQDAQHLLIPSCLYNLNESRHSDLKFFEVEALLLPRSCLLA
jgi:hypothetical protein